MTEFVSAVPIIPARDVEAAAAWYRDELEFEVFEFELLFVVVDCWVTGGGGGGVTVVVVVVVPPPGGGGGGGGGGGSW